MGTLLLGMECWQRGQKGFYGASEAVDPESLVTPWLITCGLVVVLRGLRRGHAVLRRLYALDAIRTLEIAEGWREAADYFSAFDLEPKRDSHTLWMDVLGRYSRSTGQFLFGTPSQYRGSVRP
jgi:hypothetical protein